MKDVKGGLRRFAGIQMLIALAWLALPFVIWRRPVESFEWRVWGLNLVRSEVGLLLFLPPAFGFLAAACGLWNGHSWARRTSLVLHVGNSLLNGPIAGVSIIVLVIAAFLVPGNEPLEVLASFWDRFTSELVGPIVLASVVFSFYALRYLRRNRVRQSFQPRPFQFTLRGAFLAMTFGTVYVAAFASWSSWQDEERQVRQLGGSVSWQANDGLLWFEGEIPAPSVAEQLRGMRHIRGLDLTSFGAYSNKEKREFVHLDRLPALRTLKLPLSGITDDTLEIVAGLNELAWLDLGGTAVTDAGLEHLRALRSLRFLNVRETKVTKDGALRLQIALPDLTIRR